VIRTLPDPPALDALGQRADGLAMCRVSVSADMPTARPRGAR
jgi:hypothetical protein